MSEVITKQRENYVAQLQQTEKSIERTEASLRALRNQMEQLKGAVFAVDQVIASIEAAKKQESSVKESVKKLPKKAKEKVEETPEKATELTPES